MTVLDYIVIGAGSGGIASARRAAKHGAKVAVIENVYAQLHLFSRTVGEALVWYVCHFL